VDIDIRVLLLAGSLGSVPFHIGLGTTAHQILLLEPSEPFQKVVIVLCGSLIKLVCLKGDTGDGIRCVNAHTTLDAAAHLLTKKSRHILFFMQIRFTLVNMTEAVDLLTCQMRSRRHEISMLGLLGQIESHPRCINDCLHLLIVSTDFLPLEINVPSHLL